MMGRLMRGFLVLLKGEAIFYVIILAIAGIVAAVQAVF
jgi:hypothetical protein